jgi:hypothetical protein
MPRQFEPKLDILPEAQKTLWRLLAPAPSLGFVLYGGTAIALHLGHRRSLDFDFFRFRPLEKREIEASFEFIQHAQILQEESNTLVVLARVDGEAVKVSFFGGIGIGRLNEPLQTTDATLLVASLEDLLATKLKAILDRAEAKDYRDIAATLAAGVSLERGLAAFSKMFNRDPALPLRALGYFKGGDLASLSSSDQQLLRSARDRVDRIPDIELTPGSLA